MSNDIPLERVITKCRIHISKKGYEFLDILDYMNEKELKHDINYLENEFRFNISHLASENKKRPYYYIRDIRVENVRFEQGSLIIFFNLIIETISNIAGVIKFLDYCIEKLPYENRLLSSLIEENFNINIMFETSYFDKNQTSKTIGTTLAILFSIIALFLSVYSVWLAYENSKTTPVIIKEEVKEEVKDALREEKINIIFNNTQRSNSDTETSTKK